MTTTSKNEYLQKMETLILETRQRLDAQRSTGQDQIDAIQAQIDALEAELEPLPREAKTLRMSGLAARSREVTEEIESLNIKIATLQVQQAKLEADRLKGFGGAFQAIFPEVNRLAYESGLAGEKRKREIEQERLMALNLASQPNIYERQYSQEADEALRRLKEAQDRLNRAINGAVSPAA